MQHRHGQVRRAHLHTQGQHSSILMMALLVGGAAAAYIVHGGVGAAHVGLGDLEGPEDLDDPGTPGESPLLILSSYNSKAASLCLYESGIPEDSDPPKDLGHGAHGGLLPGGSLR